MLNDRKVAGAAQRRTRRGLLHQGSIQHIDVANGLAERFAGALSLQCQTRELNSELLQRAKEIAAQKYGTEAWLRKR
jgi:lipoate-protein ligase A